jgi:arylsulfatase
LTGVNDADYSRRSHLPPGSINKLTLKVDRPRLSPEDIKKLEDGMKKAAAGCE